MDIIISKCRFIGRPILMVQYVVSDSGGNQIANEIKDIVIGVTVDYVASALD